MTLIEGTAGASEFFREGQKFRIDNDYLSRSALIPLGATL